MHYAQIILHKAHLKSLAFHLGPKQHSKEESIFESAVNVPTPDVVPTSRDDIHDQPMAGLCCL